MPSIFAQIARREIPSHTIREDQTFYAFLDIRPIVPGHTLVIPKLEVDHFFDLDDTHLAQILVFAKPIADALKRVTGVERVGMAVAGFDVPHAHLHLIPAHTMADFNFANAKSRPAEELAGLAERIRQALSDVT